MMLMNLRRLEDLIERISDAADRSWQRVLRACGALNKQLDGDFLDGSSESMEEMSYRLFNWGIWIGGFTYMYSHTRICGWFRTPQFQVSIYIYLHPFTELFWMSPLRIIESDCSSARRRRFLPRVLFPWIWIFYEIWFRSSVSSEEQQNGFPENGLSGRIDCDGFL